MYYNFFRKFMYNVTHHNPFGVRLIGINKVRKCITLYLTEKINHLPMVIQYTVDC